MKILVLANNSAGLYSFREKLLETLIENGAEVDISVPFGRSTDELSKLGCNLFDIEMDRRSINPLKDIRLILSYARLVLSLKPDKIISYTIKPNVYGGLIARLFRVPFYANVTGAGTVFQSTGIVNKIAVFLYRLSLKKAKTVFFENTENKEDFISKSIVNKKSAVQLNGAGVDLDKYQYTSYPTGSPIKFIFIGRVMREKGIYELLEATKKLKEIGHEIEVHILGSYEENCEAIITKYAEEGLIVYHGYQEDIRTFVEKSHCFVLPSYHEGMANTLLECGAMGRPLITSNIHGCKEAVIDGKTGFLCNTMDCDDLALKMKQFIELSDNEKEEMGRASCRHISDVFDKRDVVNKTMQYLML